MLLDELYKMLEAKKDEMYSKRHYLHQHPELSFQETETSKFIAKFYEGKDVEVITGVGGNGIKVIIDSGKPGKTIALRADFDALPIQEDTGLECSSVNKGIMHACGHDAHTAYLMTLADCLIDIKDKLVGKVVIIHQPGEEVPPGGSSLMIKDGVLDGVDNIFGCHVMSQMDYGKIYYHKGATQQARAKFNIKIQGKGGHGSSPHEANDSIVCASYMVSALQTIVSRRLNPFHPGVVTIGSFGGEGTFNIIKDSVELIGDVRCMYDEDKKIIEDNVNMIAKGIGSAFGCGIDVDYKNDYPVLMNDDEMTQLVVDAVTQANIADAIVDCGPLPPSEDFAYYTRVLPASFFYIGASKEGGSYPHHHPKFDIREDSMMMAAKAMGAVTLKYMNLM